MAGIGPFWVPAQYGWVLDGYCGWYLTATFPEVLFPPFFEPAPSPALRIVFLSTEYDMMTQPIRVVVANQPRLVRELVLETIIEQPDMEIVAEIKNEEEILHAVDGTHPDFLIIAPDESGRRPSLCDTWLLRYPKIKILALAPERSVVSFSGPHSIFTQSGGSVPRRNAQHLATQEPVRRRLDVRLERI